MGVDRLGIGVGRLGMGVDRLGIEGRVSIEGIEGGKERDSFMVIKCLINTISLIKLSNSSGKHSSRFNVSSSNCLLSCCTDCSINS